MFILHASRDLIGRVYEFFISVFMVLAIVVGFSLGYAYLAVNPWELKKRIRQQKLMKIARTLGFQASRVLAQYEEGSFKSVKIEVDKLMFAQSAHASDGYWLGGLAFQAIGASGGNRPNTPEGINYIFGFLDEMKQSCVTVDVGSAYAAQALILRESTIDYSGNEVTYHYTFEECLLLLAKSGLSKVELGDLMKATIGFEDILNRDPSIPVALLKEIYVH